MTKESAAAATPKHPFVGGTDRELYEQAQTMGCIANIPAKHNPVLHPTLGPGVEAIIVAARAWLSQ